MIKNRLGGIKNLLAKFLETLFDHANEDLICSYQPNGGLIMSEYIKSRLCPDSFFPLKEVKIDVPKEKQQRIFELLELKEIFEIIVEYKETMSPNCDLVQIIKKQVII